MASAAQRLAPQWSGQTLERVRLLARTPRNHIVIERLVDWGVNKNRARNLIRGRGLEASAVELVLLSRAYHVPLECIAAAVVNSRFLALHLQHEHEQAQLEALKHC